MVNKPRISPKWRLTHEQKAPVVSVHNYRVFGLTVASELELPELLAGDTETVPNVVIQRAAIAGQWEAGLHKDGDALVLVIPDVARFRIAGGQSITVDAPTGVPERNVRIFLLGSAFGALLHQRGLLPLHANAVEIEGKAVAFMGESGAGKSTLAAWFHDRGHRVLADDVCVVRSTGGGRPVISSGLPRLRLWAEALELTGRDVASFDRSYLTDADQFDKFDVPIKSTTEAGSDIELGALYLLRRGDEFAVTELSGAEAGEAVIANIYRGSYVAAVNGHKNLWRTAVDIVRSTPIYRVTRKWDLSSLDDQCQRLQDHAQAVVDAR